YPWPVIRLANTYLLYAEALNEAYGTSRSNEALEYVDRVRERAGLLPVRDAWSGYSSNPGKPNTQEGLRDIIRQERLIELALEGQRFWDLRRWKEAAGQLNSAISGWDIQQEAAADYYRENIVFSQRFTTREYLWPIDETEVLKNRNMVQNPGW